MNKTSINNGLFLGIALIISSYSLYLANPRMFFAAKGFVLLLIFILILVKTGIEVKKANGGYIGFGEAFKNMFITGAIGTFLCTFFEFIHFNFLSPELLELQKELSIETAEKLLELIEENRPQYLEVGEQYLDKIQEEENLAGFSNTITNFIGRLVAPTALLSALIALIIKTRRAPLDDNEDNEKRYIVNK